MPALTAWLQSHQTQQAAVASELCTLIRNGEEGRGVIMKAQLLPALVTLLSSDQMLIQEQATAAVRALAVSSLQVRNALGSAGALPPLAALLMSAQSLVKVQAAEAMVAMLIGSQLNKDAAIASRVLWPLLGAAWSEQLSSREYATQALFHLAAGIEQNIKDILAARVMPLLIPMLDNDFWFAALTLGNLAGNSHEAAYAISRENAMPALVQLLASQDNLVQQGAADALWGLAYCSKEAGQTIIARAALPAMLALVESARDNVQYKAAFVLHNWAFGSTAVTIVDAGCIPVLIMLIKSSMDKQLAELSACTIMKSASALEYLALQNQQCKEDIIAAGSLPVLLALLRSGSGCVVQLHSLLLLQELAAGSLQNAVSVVRPAKALLRSCQEAPDFGVRWQAKSLASFLGSDT